MEDIVISDTQQSSLVKNSLEHESSETASVFYFEIIKDLSCQLICVDTTNDRSTLIVLVPFPVSSECKPHMFASAIAPVLSPVDILAQETEITLRISATGDPDSIPYLMNECIVLLRHVLKSICMSILKLTEGTLNSQKAMELVMQNIQPPLNQKEG